MTTNNEFKDIVGSGVELEKRGEHASAMELLQEAIAEAVRNGECSVDRHVVSPCCDNVQI